MTCSPSLNSTSINSPCTRLRTVTVLNAVTVPSPRKYKSRSCTLAASVLTGTGGINPAGGPFFSVVVTPGSNHQTASATNNALTIQTSGDRSRGRVDKLSGIQDFQATLQGAKGHFKSDIFCHGLGSLSALLRRVTDPHHISVGTDFRKHLC